MLYTEINAVGLVKVRLRASKMASVHYYVYMFILVTFRGKLTASLQTHHLMILPRPAICLEQKQNTDTLSCIFPLNTSLANLTSPFANWSFRWYLDGQQLENSTINDYSNKSIISRLVPKSPGLFTCVVKQRNISINQSVVVGTKPTPVSNLVNTPKFISDKQGFHYVEVSWLNQGSKYGYSLVFTIDSDVCFSIPCPQGEIQPSCTQTHCTARIDPEGFDLSKLCFYIVTQRGMCEAKSKVWKYNITLISCGVLPPQTLLFIPFSPTNLSIETYYRRVTLTWEDILLSIRTVLLEYTCSKATYTSLLSDKNARVIVLSDKDIRNYAPYEICTFCLSIQEYDCGHFSEPLCKTTRLYEEPPTEAPNITCSTDSCPSTYNNQFRNLTVTWSLPPEKTWGGVLREVKLYYRSANSTWKEIVINDVLSTKYAILKNLNKTLDYQVYLQACNREGCSRKSNDLLVSRIRLTGQKISKNNDNSSSFNDVWYIPIAGGGILVIGLIVFMYVICFKRPRRQPRKSLESLSETGNQYCEPLQEDKYNELNGNDYSTLDGVNDSDAQPQTVSTTA